jgi:nitric oxide synthase-interacting protein
LKQSSFWLPEFAPDAGEKRIEKPPKRAQSPFSGAALRLKDLVPVTLVLDEMCAKTGEKTKNALATGVRPGVSSRFLCAVSQKQIGSQPCVVITKTGVVMIEEHFKSLVLPEMRCPVSGKKFKEKHILRLLGARSSFAGAGARMAKKWRASEG